MHMKEELNCQGFRSRDSGARMDAVQQSRYYSGEDFQPSHPADRLVPDAYLSMPQDGHSSGMQRKFCAFQGLL